MDKEKLQSFMQASGGDWITWKRNPPYASHMGGVWERQICPARSILSSLMQTHSRSLDEESLAMLMTETEVMLNSQSLTTDNISDPTKRFLRTDLYSCRRWRWVQHTVNEFWCHWRKEFLQSLQERKKWTNTKRNLKVGDVVIYHQE